VDPLETKAKEIMTRQQALESQRQPWVTHWEDVASYLLPRYAQTFRLVNQKGRTQAVQNTDKIFDPAPTLALNKFAAAMDSMLTPRTQKWHRLRSTDDTLNRNANVTRYFDDVAQRLFKFRYAPKANFSSQMFEHWQSIGAFGTACMFVDRLDGGGLRYKSLHLGEVFFSENHQGVIDTVYRKFLLKAYQAVRQFGDKCPKPIREAAENDTRRNEEYTFIHAVYPNKNKDSKRKDYKGMAYASCYIACNPLAVISEGGYETFPFPISRYVTAAGEMYGRSPASEVLPAIKGLNEQKKTVLKMGQRAVDPILLAYDDGVVGTVNLRPGYVNYGAIDSQGRKLVQPLDGPSNLVIGKDLMEDERSIINEGFWVTLFQILVETPQMTATEVMERVKEKAALLAPMMGRQQSECLGPLIERELDILQREGVLPPMPPELVEAGGEFEIIYESPLSRSMQAEEASGFMRTLETAINVSQATQDPAALDWLNVDVAMPEIADIQAVPARWLRSLEEVQSIRQNRQSAAEQQQMADAAPAIASILKTTGSAA
jgi:hypothetical protein